MTTPQTYSISEVSRWELDGIVEVPALQRGLVWEPHQVELLWDSILRGFPIGAFALTPIKGNESQLTQAGTEGNGDCEGQQEQPVAENYGNEGLLNPSAQYFLLDGQQRYNAIKAAFTPWRDDAKAVLWIDFMPSPNTGSTRRFWVKVTTKAHPWGFANNDGCSLLGWSAYREALKRFTGSEETRIQDVRMSSAWPLKARCPIPFERVLEIFKESEGVSSKDTVSEFCVGIVAWCKEHEAIGVETKDFDLVARTSRTLFGALSRMRDYPIVANILEAETLDAQDVIGEEELADEGTNNLEQLFTRINTLGTPISPYDLRYSAIKAYWGNIKRSNDDIAGTIMPAANLAIFSFRLALTLSGDRKEFADTPSVQRIRHLKFKDDQESRGACGIVDELYEHDGTLLRSIIQDIESALHVFKHGGDDKDGLPAVIRTSIIQNSPDVYLLFLYMAYKKRLGDFGHLVGLATWLHWFSIDQQKKLVDEIKTVVDNENCSLELLKRLLSDLCKRNALMIPVQPDKENFREPKNFLTNEGKTCDWSPFESRSWYPLFDRIWTQRELVIFATRRYFNKEFQYDPAETKFLTGHNKPWDMDHIIPKSWVSRQGVEMGEYKAVCREWIWSNGNFAAIPFTMNRRKGNREDWGYYHLDPERMKNLFFDEHFLNLESDTMTSDESMAMLFIRTAHARMIAMYEEWRTSVEEYLL